MKHKIFDAIGQIDDHILDRFRKMDLALARQHTRKRHMRVLAIAAAMVLLIVAFTLSALTVAFRLGLLPPPPPHVDPPAPKLFISVQSMQEFEKMREMIDCEDEQELAEYLQGLNADGVEDRQDLVGFVELAQGMPCAWIMDGEVTYMSYTISTTDQDVFSMSISAENGDELLYHVYLNMTDPDTHLASLKDRIGKENLLDSPLSTTDGRLTLHTETREPHASGTGDMITWWGELDGMVVEIRYCVANADTVDTRQLIANLTVSELLPKEDPFPKYTWSDTVYGAFDQRLEHAITGVTDSPGSNYDPPTPVWNTREYQDADAQQTVVLNVLGVDYTLEYWQSQTATESWQARHEYRGENIKAWLDQETGECMYVSLNVDLTGTETVSKEQRLQIARDFLAEHVPDPEAYWEQVQVLGPITTSYTYTRFVGELPTADKVTVWVDSHGNIEFYSLAYTGAFRQVKEIPDEVIAKAENILNYYAQGEGSSCEIKRIVVTEDGRLGLECQASSKYTDDNGTMWDSGCTLVIFLTEPIK